MVDRNNKPFRDTYRHTSIGESLQDALNDLLQQGEISEATMNMVLM